jgi:hypothetical protein
MRENMHYKIIFQDNQAPISYWRSSKNANKPSYGWFYEHYFLYEPTTEIFFNKVLRDENGNFIYNPVAYLKAQDNFQPVYCKRIIKIVEFQLGKEETSGLSDHADTLFRPYTLTRLLTTSVGKLSKNVGDITTIGDLLEDTE